MAIKDDALKLNEEMGWELFPANKKNGSYRDMTINGRRWGASADPEQIDEFFTRWPRSSIGLPTGTLNGIFVVDGDTPEGHKGKDGMASIRRLEREHGPLPETLMADTPSKGRHWYFKYPPGMMIRPSNSKLAVGVDIKGEGAMVVAAPSRRGGGAYAWVNWGTPIADAPAWLLDAIKEEPRETPLNNLANNFANTHKPPTKGEIRAAMEAIHNPVGMGWDKWNKIAMALWRAMHQADEELEFGEELLVEFTRRWAIEADPGNEEIHISYAKRKWAGYTRSPPNQVTVGTIFDYANQDAPGWRQVYEAKLAIKPKVDKKKKAAEQIIGDDEEPPEEDAQIIPDEAHPRDFWAHLPSHEYIYEPTGALWPAASVNDCFRKMAELDQNGQPAENEDGELVLLSPAKWLSIHKPIHQILWSPKEDKIVHGKHLIEGGWTPKKSAQCFNMYIPPLILPSGRRASDPTMWLDHVHLIYPNDADHAIKWFAHHVQRPGVKVNHSLVLLGAPGIGKDMLLKPVIYAVGPWNFQEITPQDILSAYNGYLQCVILRINEARDLGEMNRYQFYERTKIMMAAPPEILRVNDKYIKHRAIENCCGVTITMNEKESLYLPVGDRRHYVLHSEFTRTDHEEDYFNKLMTYYSDGGYLAVRNYLANLDLSDFDAKAPPPETQAFWEIVENSQAPETSDFAAVALAMGDPPALTARMLRDFNLNGVSNTTDRGGMSNLSGFSQFSSFFEWLDDRKNRRQIPRMFSQGGYAAVRNPLTTDGRWRVNDEQTIVYAKSTLDPQGRLRAAQAIATGAVVVPIRRPRTPPGR
jgi:Bifunctional DNA primase/polymerase, N-terminal/Primase C terminal 2 (PriCT-2)